jgi:hypothetical protein
MVEIPGLCADVHVIRESNVGIQFDRCYNKELKRYRAETQFRSHACFANFFFFFASFQRSWIVDESEETVPSESSLAYHIFLGRPLLLFFRFLFRLRIPLRYLLLPSFDIKKHGAHTLCSLIL